MQSAKSAQRRSVRTGLWGLEVVVGRAEGAAGDDGDEDGEAAAGTRKRFSSEKSWEERYSWDMRRWERERQKSQAPWLD